MKVNLGGNIVELITINELAKLCGRSAATMKKYEQRGLLPRANWRTKPSANAKFKEGNRLYSIDLAKKLAVVFKDELQQGVATPENVRQKIKDLFTEEKQKYAT